MGTAENLHRQKYKTNLKLVMGGKCAICGYDKCFDALECHHIDESKKNFNLSNAHSHSWEDVCAELQKCILICSNCHREIHAGVNTQELKTSYNEELAKTIDHSITEIKFGKPNYCIDCGEIISHGATRCVKCNSINRQEHDRPDRDTLKDLIRTRSFLSIGKDYGVSDHTISKWAHAADLPDKKRIINAMSDEEWALI